MISMDSPPVAPATEILSVYCIVLALCIVYCLCSDILLARVASLVNSRSAKFSSRRSFARLITANYNGFLCDLKTPKLRNCSAVAICSSLLLILVVYTRTLNSNNY